MKNAWKFWLTGLFWVIVLVSISYNGYAQKKDFPSIDMWGWELGLFMIACVGLVGAFTKNEGFNKGFGLFILLFGIATIVTAPITTTTIDNMWTFLLVGAAITFAGLPNTLLYKI